MKIFVTLPILALVASPAAAEPIVATAPWSDSRSVIVSVADLNLKSNGGLDRLDRRLRSAARLVCDVRPDPEPLLRKSSAARCFKDALEDGREAGRQLVAARQVGTLAAAAATITIIRP
ncbi:UrcA family protein [Sphingopyxis alaskensis]|jgi:UrcA family protein|uniref:UrcA family protein n=1 Tax=Sphingopyxis alaskensis (strain DSM 13593 / LMG 18877 / RB2256) TaxID=317655 RepID=Q1GNE8_SPHAL|nr:UrcA family protein [Sphingopyxis alaskensis]ABF54824.1 hypothetical protein Sala_3121 [Sphingopyxis alaskensis RB2256]MCM3421155.1 UrcA family protein [Sphingopyxis alaskensis]